MSDSYATLDVVRAGGLLWLTLNRPDSLNAMSRGLVSDLHALFDRLHDDRETRVVVLRGAGRAFCAGLDLKEGPDPQADGSVASGLRGQRRIAELMIKIHRLQQVFIACVHGAASGWPWPPTCASPASRRA